MAKTIEVVLAEAPAELSGKPPLIQMIRRLEEREPYSGPPVAALIREDRDSR